MMAPWVGAGWHPVRDRIVTSWAPLQGLEEAGDDLTVWSGEGRWLKATVLLRDVRIGLVVLSVPGLGGPELPPPKAPAESAVAMGARVLALRPQPPTGEGAPLEEGRVLAPEELLDFLLAGPPPEPERAWYFELLGGPLPMGTPLFDLKGEILSLVGLPGSRGGVAGLALPDEALWQLLQQAEAWWPSKIPASKP